MHLPALDATLDHAIVESVEFAVGSVADGAGGHEATDVTLVLGLPTWCGRSPTAPSRVRLAFNAVANSDEVRSFFGVHERSELELATVRYAFGLRSAPGSVAVDVTEAGGRRLRIRCGAVTLLLDP